VSHSVVHPQFAFEGFAEYRGVRADLAVLRLDRPIDPAAAQPIPPAGLEQQGAPLAIVSYARDRAQAPSIESPCQPLVRIDAVVALDCAVTDGASGAPLLQGEGGDMRLVGVVSAMGRILATDADVTLAVLAADGLAALLEALRPAESAGNERNSEVARRAAARGG
jgi:hypothetical protein